MTALILSCACIQSNHPLVESFSPSSLENRGTRTAFPLLPPRSISHYYPQHHSSSALGATTNFKATKNRNEILKSNGSHFALNRVAGTVEFGATTKLVTRLVGPPTASSNPETRNKDRILIEKWLSDERRIANSIWKPELLTDLGGSVYRLQLMTLQFVTIQLAPHVDTAMWVDSEPSSSSSSSTTIPVFKLQSIDFDPNIQLLPGLPGITPESLGINIEVVGELRPSPDGRSVSGVIGFRSGGKLPTPMRLMPEGVLRGAGKIIDNTVIGFVSRAFERGAADNFRRFRLEEERKKKKTD